MPQTPLQYSASEPAFLRRLKAGFTDDAHRNNVQHARPNKSRLKVSADDSDEDKPVIVDETGEVLGKDEWNDRVKSAGQEEDKGDSNADADADNIEQVQQKQQKIADIGSGTNLGKKRKVAKVIADEQAEDDNDEAEISLPMKSMSKATDDFKSIVKDSKDAAKKEAEVQKSKDEASKTADISTGNKKKKAKKIKLSFDEPD